MGDNLMKIRSNNSARGWTHFEQTKDAVERELGYGPTCSARSSPRPT